MPRRAGRDVFESVPCPSGCVGCHRSGDLLPTIYNGAKTLRLTSNFFSAETLGLCTLSWTVGRTTHNSRLTFMIHA